MGDETIFAISVLCSLLNANFNLVFHPLFLNALGLEKSTLGKQLVTLVYNIILYFGCISVDYDKPGRFRFTVTPPVISYWQGTICSSGM
jgi:hypothetical protein